MYDVCANRKIDQRIENDATFIAQQLQAGSADFNKMFTDYTKELQKRDNYPASDQPFLTDQRTLLSALHCKDPEDVTITTKPADLGANKPLDFKIDMWKANTNEIYETAKGLPITPDLARQASEALNNNIPAGDRDLAAAQFNHRARKENQPMEVILDPKTNTLRFQAKDRNMEASK
jgi:hypothetical protein